MATTLVYKQVVSGSDDNLEAFVGSTATNKAFSLNKQTDGYMVTSHITKKEGRSGGPFATLDKAKAFCDTVLEQENIPQNGTVLSNT